MLLIDTHTHLNDERYKGRAGEIINNLSADGVECVVNIGYDRKSSEISLRLAQKYANVYCALAVHPHSAKEFTVGDYDFFKEAAENPKAVAIGEAGLDYFRDLSPRDIQREVFVRHIHLAEETNLPLVVHIRDAYEDAYRILSENAGRLTAGCLLHCYSGRAETAKRFLTIKTQAGELLNVYFAFGGTLTYKNNRTAPEVLKILPRDRILLETDCPYLTPEPHRGELNAPAYVAEVARAAAEVLGITLEEAARLTTENAKRFFGKIENGKLKMES